MARGRREESERSGDERTAAGSALTGPILSNCFHAVVTLPKMVVSTIPKRLEAVI